MKLLTFAAGLATGYVLGTRAGRERYQQIADAAGRLWANPSADEARRVVDDLRRPQVPALQTPTPAASTSGGTSANGTASARRAAQAGPKEKPRSV